MACKYIAHNRQFRKFHGKMSRNENQKSLGMNSMWKCWPRKESGIHKLKY